MSDMSPKLENSDTSERPVPVGDMYFDPIVTWFILVGFVVCATWCLVRKR